MRFCPGITLSGQKPRLPGCAEKYIRNANPAFFVKWMPLAGIGQYAAGNAEPL